MLNNTEIAPRGWNSWDCYGAAVNEETVRKNAEFMAKNLKQFGWEYIVVDIQWSNATADTNEYQPFCRLYMDEYSRLIPAPERFPSSAGGKGFAPLAEYVHSLGLKFGIHIMRGIPRQAVAEDTPILGTDITARQIAKTASICYWNTDMYGVDPAKEGAKEYYDSLLKLYASWGVDFIKCDDICRELPREESELVLLSNAVKDCERNIVFSLSPGPALIEKAELYKDTANMWRITDDFWDDWKLLYNMFERCEKWCIHTGYGNFPDADMLPIGPIRQVYDVNERTKFTKDEQITMMTLWSIFRSPLMIGGEMTGFDDFTMSLITNPEVLKMHEMARHSHPVCRVKTENSEYVLWIAACADGGSYIAAFNLGEADCSLYIPLKQLELPGSYQFTELWSGERKSGCTEVKCSLKPHGAMAWKVIESA